MQGTESGGFKFVLWQLDKKLQSMDARIVHIIHDEIIVETRDEIAEKVEEIVKNCMKRAFEQLELRLPMIAEPDIRNAWE